MVALAVAEQRVLVRTESALPQVLAEPELPAPSLGPRSSTQVGAEAEEEADQPQRAREEAV